MEHIPGITPVETKEEKAASIASSMRVQTEQETAENFRFVMEGMLADFEAAITNPENASLREVAIENLHKGENYLGEKYRDTHEERAYLQVIREAITYLS